MSRALTNAEIRARIKRLVKKWCPLLGLDNWVIKVHFDEHEDTGSCESWPSYEDAVLHFNLPEIRKELRTYHGMQELVVHELVHCIIWKSSERAVTQIARAILRAAGLKYK